jgi:copper chaperone NosL
MIVSDVHLAAQIAAPGEESRFFDDIACLAGYLQKHPQPAATVYVADHRTGQWVPVEQAIFGRLPRPSTPMASGLLAHASAESKAQDAGAKDAVTVSRDIAFGPRTDVAR